jgi:hypothetical protein
MPAKTPKKTTRKKAGARKMTLSRRLFRLWVILAGLWVAYIGYRSTSFVMWPTAGEPTAIWTRMIIASQWSVHWALIPPAALLLGGWLILWAGRRFRSL